MTALTDRLDEIAARADAATDGPWEPKRIEFRDTAGHTVKRGDLVVAFVGYESHEPLRVPVDAAFIAAARADVPALVAALRDVLALHAPMSWSEAEPTSGEMDEDYSLTHPLPPFCRECTDDEYVGAIEHGDVIDIESDVVYCPCPTVAAITTALDGAK